MESADVSLINTPNRVKDVSLRAPLRTPVLNDLNRSVNLPPQSRNQHSVLVNKEMHGKSVSKSMQWKPDIDIMNYDEIILKTLAKINQMEK